MSYEDSDSTVAALKIINRLLDKIQDLEKREHAERVEKMLVAQAAKPPLDVLEAWKARWKAETKDIFDGLQSADFLQHGKLTTAQKSALLGFLRSLEASL